MWEKSKRTTFRSVQLSALVSVFIAASTAALAGNGVANAAVTDEMIFVPVFDGTRNGAGQFDPAKPTEDDPAEMVLVESKPGVEYAKHYPGNDSGPNNGVVRTFDLYAVKADWSINEGPATNVQIVFTLPSNSQWKPDQTQMFSGCDPLKSTISDGIGTDWDADNKPVEKTGVNNVLTCVIGDVPEGSHGTITPIAALGLSQDQIRLPVTAKLTSDQNPDGVNKELAEPFTVSERPRADWVKLPGIIAPNIVTADDEAKTKGYVMTFPIALQNQLLLDNPPKGAGELESAPLSMADHFYDSPQGARLATSNEYDASGLATGEVCGPYVQGGSLPVGEGTWACEDPGDLNDGFPYFAWRLKVGAYPNLNEPPKPNMNQTPNVNNFVLSGQITFFLPYDQVEADKKANGTDSVRYQNAISGSWDKISDPKDPVPFIKPVMIAGLPGPPTGDVPPKFIETQTPNDWNTGTFGGSFPVDDGGGGGRWYSHYAYFSKNLEEYAWPDYIAPYEAFSADLDVAPFPGNPNRIKSNDPEKPNGDPAKPLVWDGWGQVSRGQKIHMNYQLSTADSTKQQTLPIHGCMTWDPTQVKLQDFTDEILVKWPGTGTFFKNEPRSPSNKMYDLRFGTSNGGRTSPLSRPRIFSQPQSDETRVIVEFARTGKYKDSIAKNELTCNNSDADTNGWVNADDEAAMAQFKDPANTAQYLIDAVRVRVEGEWPWYSMYDIEQVYRDYITPVNSQMFLSLQGRIGTDLEINKNLTPVRLHSARGYGVWNPATDAFPPGEGCPYPPAYTGNRDKELNDFGVEKGWCGWSYNALAEPKFDPTAITIDNPLSTRLDPGAWSSGFEGDKIPGGGKPTFTAADFDSDSVTIVDAQPWVEKTNDNGILDIVNNGEIAQFTIKPSIIGSPAEALADVKLVDQLPKEYIYRGLIRPLSNPAQAATCTFPEEGTAGGKIECQLSAPNPADPGDLPVGLPGQWKDDVGMAIRVEVIGGISSPSGYRPITNTATTSNTQAGVWDATANGGTGGFEEGSLYPAAQEHSDFAYTYMPFAADEGAIIKSVEGDTSCTYGPDGGAPPEGWAARCKMTDLDLDASNEPTVDDAGNLTYDMVYENVGNTALTNLRFVDVFPFIGDGPPTEAPSDSEFTGDGRSPESKFNGIVGFKATTEVKGLTLDDEKLDPGQPRTPYTGYVPVTYVTGDDPKGVSRDPNTAWRETTWCDQSGNVANGVTGSCPASPYDVTAVFMNATPTVPEQPTPASPKISLKPGETLSFNLILDTEGAACTDLWTNTFGARADQMKLEIRSNDVSNMVQCDFDLALQKRVATDWAPGADWLTYGESTVDFDIEVVNQGVPVQDFDVTDYVNMDLYEYRAADNPAGTSRPGNLGKNATGPSLAYTWEGADGDKAPTAKVIGKLGVGESTIIPIRLRLKSLVPGELLPVDEGKSLPNHAEISRFDSDGDSSNGDSTTNLKDIDSTPDKIFGNDVEEDNVIDKTPETGDEDDEDIAEIPWYDLALIKVLGPDQQPVVTFNGDTANVDYLIKVKNQGVLPANNITVLDTPAVGFTYSSENPTGTTAIDGANVDYVGPTVAEGQFKIEQLLPGQEIAIPVRYVVNAAEALNGDLDNTAEITSFTDASGKSQPDVDSTPDTNPDNDAYEVPLVDGEQNVDFDADNDGDLHDIAAKTIDEDDHDREPVELRYSLGNQVWFDNNKDGKVTPGEPPVPGVVVNLYSADGPAGSPVGEPIQTTTTDANGLYLFSGLTPGKYLVGIDNANFDGPLDGYKSSPVTDNTPDDDIDEDDNGIGEDVNVISGVITMGPTEPLKEPGPNNDTNADILSNLTVDFGFYKPEIITTTSTTSTTTSTTSTTTSTSTPTTAQPPTTPVVNPPPVFDLAQRKVLGDNQVPIITKLGEQITWKIEVFNQGAAYAKNIVITDYLPSYLQLDDPDWTMNGSQARYELPGTLAPGASTSVDITTKLVATPPQVDGQYPIINYSEICKATPVDNTGKVLTDKDGNVITDTDSTPDCINGNDKLINDRIDLTPASGDEDDHDIEQVVLNPVKPPPTGADVRGFLLIGGMSVTLGAMLLGLRGRRRQGLTVG